MALSGTAWGQIEEEEPDTTAEGYLKRLTGIEEVEEDTTTEKFFENFNAESEDTTAANSNANVGALNLDEEAKGKDTIRLIDKAKEYVNISGGLGITTAYYNAFGAPPQRDPFYWQLTGSLDLTIGEISLPFSATLNQQERSFTQPFNQYGVSPKYKWVTAHIGFRTMRFSEYSLSGNQFLGGGIELMPEKFPVRGKMLFGRFARAVDGYYTDGQVSGTPSFERWGWGVLLETGKPKNSASLYLFKGKDDKNSIVEFANDATIKPAENLIVGISTKQEFKKHFNFTGELNFSAYTRDTRTEETVLEGYTYLNNLGSLFYANATSTFNKAMKGEFSYTNKKLKVGLGYRRVDPDYLSMGSVYLNNDFEDIQLQSMFRMLKNKISLSLSGGLQRNNLNNDKATEMLRLIASVAGTYTINQQWNVMLNFSNFNSESQMVVVNSLDTMRYAQVTRNATGQLMYNKSFKKVRVASGLSGNYQNARIFQNDSLNANSSSELVNSSLSFQLGFLKSAFNISASLNGAMNITGERMISTLGPTLSLSKRFFAGKLTTALSASMLKSFLDNLPSGFIMNLKSNTNYRINKHHALTNTLSFIGKQQTGANKNQQFIGTLGYNYVF
jgi:hypothetical protein